MKLPNNWHVNSLSASLFDDGCNGVTVATRDEGAGVYLVLTSDPTGVTLDRGDLHRLAEIGDWLIAQHEEMERASDEPTEEQL